MPEQMIEIGFSPCPNDCFIFDAMIHGRIDTEGLRFKPVMEDVETLNQMAMRAELPVTKLSYHAFAYVLGSYELLDAGSALGNACGPLLITKQDPGKIEERLKAGDPGLKIVIPGRLTTANFLFSIAFPKISSKTELLFSEIEDAVLAGTADAGLIIHENRFTYEAKGLKKVIDLGEYWETTVNAPIPLGGIFVRRSEANELRHKINRIIRRSVEFAFAHPGASRDFVKINAQEMSEEVMQKHIGLYVNNYSVDLGAEGRRAVEVLFAKAVETGLLLRDHPALFLENPTY